MARKKHSAEQIVAVLRQIEVELANHKSTGQACQSAVLFPPAVVGLFGDAGFFEGIKEKGVY